jgi:hypothetical protein
MAKYMIEAPHSAEKCNIALYEILKKDPNLPEKFDWGCNSGVHTGWIIVDAENESEARKKLPTMLQSDARVVELNKFTPDQIKWFHQK